VKMEIIPAVDLMNGKVVRLLQGDPQVRKSYEHLGDPVAIAKRWQAEGARLLHIIDLDAAFGFGNNIEVIRRIVKAVNIPVQVGGGIRSLETVKGYFSMDVNRIILGSLAFEDSSQAKQILDDFGSNRVAVALDHLDDKVMIRGWKASTNITVDEAVSGFSSLGFEFFLVTSVARDGTLGGPDLNTLRRVCGFHGIRIMAAGGINSLEDIVNLEKAGVYGAVIGKALYEGKIKLESALKTAELR